MVHKIGDIIREARLVNLFCNFNRNLLKYFYNSDTYKLFTRINLFFRNTILKNIDRSTIIKFGKKISSYIEMKDIGIFIILVVLFNMLAMIALKKEIDIFSIFGRVFCLIGGIILVFRKKR